MLISNNLNFPNRTVKYDNKILNPSSISFGSGMTPKMKMQIEACDINQVVKKLAKYGIKADFKGNKTVAWCCEQTVGIFRQLNTNYGFKLALPKEIYVEDFSKLNHNNPNSVAFCTMFPCKPIIGSSKEFPEGTIFFDNEFSWKDIDSIADNSGESKLWPSNHFLCIFIHEFSHNAHFKYLEEKIGSKKLLGLYYKTVDKNYAYDYQNGVGQLMSDISTYATTDPFETIVDDMTKRIVNNLDGYLNVIRNPFLNAPYFKNKVQYVYQLTKASSFSEAGQKGLLRRIWEGSI